MYFKASPVNFMHLGQQNFIFSGSGAAAARTPQTGCSFGRG
jgi:hypothetical protein